LSSDRQYAASASISAGAYDRRTTISAAPAGNGGHSDDVALECRPLALHPRQGTDQVEYEVAPSAFNGGYVNIDLELYRSGDDGRLGNRAFVI